MTTTTVGDLIKYLQRFDRNLAVVKSDHFGTGYNRIELIPKMIYPISVSTSEKKVTDFEDGTNLFNSFDAIVL
jgi:hypothetical protein